MKLKFWEGLGAAHSKWASKDANVREVMEVLETARDKFDKEERGQRPGIGDNNAAYYDGASDSSDDGEGEAQANGVKSNNGDLADKAKNLKKHHHDLSKRNRGLMQWKVSFWLNHVAFPDEVTKCEFRYLELRSGQSTRWRIWRRR